MRKSHSWVFGKKQEMHLKAIKEASVYVMVVKTQCIVSKLVFFAQLYVTRKKCELQERKKKQWLNTKVGMCFLNTYFK